MSETDPNVKPDAPPLPNVPLPEGEHTPPADMLGATFITYAVGWKWKKKDKCWRLEKIPTVNGTYPNAEGAASKENGTTFELAMNRARQLRAKVGPIVGVGISFFFPADFWILDLDDELAQPEQPRRLAWLLENAPTWGEISVSGNGLHFAYRGAWAVNETVQWRGRKAEIIGGGKFVALTGRHFAGSPLTLGVA